MAQSTIVTSQSMRPKGVSHPPGCVGQPRGLQHLEAHLTIALSSMRTASIAAIPVGMKAHWLNTHRMDAV